jgi:hypothetical protein
MAKAIVARMREVFEYSKVYIWEKNGDIAENMSEEDARDMETFGALQRSIRSIPHELIEQTIQLHSNSPEAFENSVLALAAAICDTFRPATAAEFVEKLNEDIRSEIEFGKSKGQDYGRAVREFQVVAVEP